MPAARIAFTTPPAAPRWRRRLWYSPAARIVWFAALVLLIGVAVYTVMTAVGWTAKSAGTLERALATLAAQLPPALIAYLSVVWSIERRTPSELSLRDAPKYGLAGLALGFVLFSTVVAILWLAGSYHVTGFHPHANWLPAVLVAGIGAGIGEEIIARGVVFRISEEGLGTWWALVISAAFFGAMHLGNPGATAWSAIAIMIEAGILLALLYHVTRSLWACIGLHAAWNVTQGTLYGIKVSGTHADGFLNSTLTGPAWLSGGAFGAEGSVVAVAVCLAASIVLLAIALRRRSIVPPFWRRREASVAQSTTPAQG